MIVEKTFTSDYRLESVQEDNGKFFFTATSLDNNFECDEGRAILAKKSIGKEYLWRHQHPIQEGNEDTHIYGQVVDSFINDKGFIESKYEIYGHTEEHLAIREAIRERQRIGKPLGVSMRYRKYFIGDKILHWDVFEHSGTPFPKCTKCTNIDFIGEKKMPENEKAKLKQKELEESLKKIGELEDQLTSRTKIFEEMKSTVETLETNLKAKSNELEKTEKTEKTLEEQIEDLKNEVTYLIKKPMLDKILEVKKLDNRELEFLKLQDEKYLGVKLEQWSKEAESKIIVTTQEESAEEAQRHADEEFDKKEPTMAKFTEHIKHKVKITEKDEKKK